jgi:hypothetical protein
MSLRPPIRPVIRYKRSALLPELARISLIISKAGKHCRFSHKKYTMKYNLPNMLDTNNGLTNYKSSGDIVLTEDHISVLSTNTTKMYIYMQISLSQAVKLQKG